VDPDRIHAFQNRLSRGDSAADRAGLWHHSTALRKALMLPAEAPVTVVSDALGSPCSTRSNAQLMPPS
jgi:hypothetical protein